MVVLLEAKGARGLVGMTRSQQKPRFFLRALQGTKPCQYLDFRLMAPELYERIHFCCLKPPGL